MTSQRRMSDGRDLDAAGDGLRERLEGELLTRHEALYGARRHGAVPGLRWRDRGAFVAAAALLVLAVVAAMPVRATRDLGLIVRIDLPAGARSPGQGEMLLHLLDARWGAGQASVSIDARPEGTTRILLLVFGPHAPAGLRAGLEQAFPALGQGVWAVQGLEADVQTSLARALGARVLAVDPDRRALERGRRVVLERLAAQGWRADVSFDRADGIRVIEIVTDHGPAQARD